MSMDGVTTTQNDAAPDLGIDLANTTGALVPNFLKSKASSSSRTSLTGSGQLPVIERVKSQDSLELLQQKGEMVSPKLSRKSISPSNSSNF